MKPVQPAQAERRQELIHPRGLRTHPQGLLTHRQGLLTHPQVLLTQLHRLPAPPIPLQADRHMDNKK